MEKRAALQARLGDIIAVTVCRWSPEEKGAYPLLLVSLTLQGWGDPFRQFIRLDDAAGADAFELFIEMAMADHGWTYSEDTNLRCWQQPGHHVDATEQEMPSPHNHPEDEAASCNRGSRP